MTNLDKAIDRVFARTDAIVDDIDAGRDPQESIDKARAAAPWDIAALGQAFVKDAVASDREAQ